MKIKIRRVWGYELDKYKDVLDDYNPIYENNDGYYHAIIEINDLDTLISLAKELKHDLIISEYEKYQVIIYDDYME
jgi:phosphorylcholine metabolism protein LicD